MIIKILNNISHILINIKDRLSLTDKGERVDINYNENKRFEEFDIYQKNHFKRYEYAKQILNQGDIVGDFACGTGYGTSMLSERSAKVIGVDINERVIKTIKKRYKKNKKIEFIVLNILNIKYKNYFDKIISFETIEHFKKKEILQLLQIYNKALKSNGEIIFSTPYMQKESEAAIKLGFHSTFLINERKIELWLKKTNFKKVLYKYQKYNTYLISDNLKIKDFIICIAKKI